MENLIFDEDNLKEKYATAIVMLADFVRLSGKESSPQMINDGIEKLIASKDNPVLSMGGFSQELH
jgi:hypothetical protein